MSFNIALSGLNSATSDLGTIANNIANANTTGFKSSRTEFGDLFRRSSYDADSAAMGAGVYVQRVAQQFDQGTINSTGNALDLAISGDGFFTLSDNGKYVYSRAGAFGTDRNGYVVNSNGQRLQVYPPQTTTGSFNTGQLVDLRLSAGKSPPSPTGSVEAVLNLPATATVPANATFSPLDATSYNHTTSVTVYDSLGTPHTASMYYVRAEGPSAWNLHVTIDGNAVGDPVPLQFNSAGVLSTPANGAVSLDSFTLSNGAAPLSLSLDLAEATQYGDTFGVSTMTQDGYATGELGGLSVTEEGIVQALYTNGQVVDVGQLAMASFANMQGLQQLGTSSWGETHDSGQVVLGVAGAAGYGTVQAGALESSNVDLTEQLVTMMTTQRNYQANSQVISTTDQLLQSIMNLR
jgi:flagellar hook protein FlgE